MMPAGPSTTHPSVNSAAESGDSPSALADQSLNHHRTAEASPPWWCIHFSDVKVLSKPRITLMVLITTLIGFVMADRVVGAQSMYYTLQDKGHLLLITLLGTCLSCMGACVFNQVYERDTDALMKRTRNRPLPSGRASVFAASVVGMTFCVLGVLLLAVLVNGLTAIISAFTIFSYVLLYTPLKRISSISTIIGAVPGALPPVMGYTAVTNDIGIVAVLLFGILFLWQLPHFLAIAWLYRDEYGRAGMPMLPVVDPEGSSTFRHMLISCMALVPLGMLPTILGVSGRIYFVGSLIASLGFLWFGIALVRGKTRAHARAMFFASLIYMPVVIFLMMINQL